MFIFWLLVFAILAAISGIIGFSRTPPPIALAARALLPVFVLGGLAFLFYGAVKDFQIPGWMELT